MKEGADDYIVKPPSQIELLARVEAVLRRDPQRKHLVDQAATVAPQANAPTARDVVETLEEPPEVWELHEGALMLEVHGPFQAEVVDAFVGQLRKIDEIRVMRLSDNRLGGADILLNLQQPMLIRDMLVEMSGVRSVSRSTVKSLAVHGDVATFVVMLTEQPVTRNHRQA